MFLVIFLIAGRTQIRAEHKLACLIRKIKKINYSSTCQMVAVAVARPATPHEYQYKSSSSCVRHYLKHYNGI